MNRIFYFVLLVMLCACSGVPMEGSAQAEAELLPEKSNADQTAEPFVVLELFTSEGCSDCPTAEAWLNELTRDAIADKSYVYPLSFHVDYWNKLGWRDIFSDSAYSNRQRQYRKAFGNEVVYTPQMVINGKTEFVGSDRDRTRKEMKSALSQTPPLFFHIEPNADWNSLSYEVVSMQDSIEASMQDFRFQVAIVERNLVTEVKRGENKNKTLEHENVVRYFAHFPFTNRATVDLTHELDNIDKDFSIITLVQHKSSMTIVGANIWNF